VQTVADAYAVYGKTTKAGLFTITAKKKKGTYYETLKYRVLVRPKAVDVDVFGETLTNITTMAYVPVEWDLMGEDGGRAGTGEDGHAGRATLPVVSNVVKVAGLPAGVTFAAKDTYGYANAKRKTGKYLKQSAQTIVGKPTKPGTYVVTFTKNVKEKVKGKMTTVAKTAQILWVVEPNNATVELGFNTAGGVIKSGVVGLKYGDLLAFGATSNAMVTASGLPSGIKLVRVDGGHAGRVTLPGEAVWGFEGFTAKAGTYLVTVKATLNGRSVTQRLALEVKGLPAWAKGTFNGVVSRTGCQPVQDGGTGQEENAQAARSTRGLATVTVGATGKISGKFYEGGTNWTFSAASYTAATSATAPAEGMSVGNVFSCSNVVAKYTYKVKEKVKGKWKTVPKTLTREFALVVAADPEFSENPESPKNPESPENPVRGLATMEEVGGRGATALPGEDGGHAGRVTLPGTVVAAWQNLWGRSDYKTLGKQLFSTKSGKKTLAYKTFAVEIYTNETGACYFKNGDGVMMDAEGGSLGEAALPNLTYFAALSLKVTTVGAVTATLTYDTGKTKKDSKTKKTVKVYYKPTCQSVVVPLVAPDAGTFAGEVWLYFAPSTGNKFPGWNGAVPF